MTQNTHQKKAILTKSMTQQKYCSNNNWLSEIRNNYYFFLFSLHRTIISPITPSYIELLARCVSLDIPAWLNASNPGSIGGRPGGLSWPKNPSKTFFIIPILRLRCVRVICGVELLWFRLGFAKDFAQPVIVSVVFSFSRHNN